MNDYEKKIKALYNAVYTEIDLYRKEYTNVLNYIYGVDNERIWGKINTLNKHGKCKIFARIPGKDSSIIDVYIIAEKDLIYVNGTDIYMESIPKELANDVIEHDMDRLQDELSDKVYALRFRKSQLARIACNVGFIRKHIMDEYNSYISGISTYISDMNVSLDEIRDIAIDIKEDEDPHNYPY